jgi:hypothetical protein
MNKLINFIRQNKGVIAIEASIYLLIIVTSIWFISEITTDVRYNNMLNRSAATFSEIMVNQQIPEPGDEGTADYEINTLTALIDAELKSGVALAMLTDMVMPEGLTGDNLLGMKVTYLDTTQPGSGGKQFYEKSYKTGDLECQPVKETVTTPNLQDFANKLKVNGLVVDTKLIMVEVCSQTQKKSIGNFIMPTKYYTYCISANKD